MNLVPYLSLFPVDTYVDLMMEVSLMLFSSSISFNMDTFDMPYTCTLKQTF